MSQFQNDVNGFKNVGIQVLQRGEEPYERSVATNNRLFRFARPDFVVQPETPSDVQKIVKLARDRGLSLTIKCGGHSYAGHSTAFEGGVSVDLRRMNNVDLKLDSGTITFGAGCIWGEVYKTLVNGGHNGYVVNGGRCPYVGVGGFVLGGGLGPFSRSIGMGSDTVEEITIVTADSKLVTVKKTDKPGSAERRLFWALCGAGGGNFGVVVEMKLKVHKLRSEDVVAGRYQWFGKKEDDLFAQADFLATMNKIYTAKWPEHFTLDVTWLCDLRKGARNGVRFVTYFDGAKEEFNEIINTYIKPANAEIAEQLIRRSMPEKSTRFLHETLVAQWSEETIKAFPTNKTYSIHSSFVFRNDPETIAKVTKLVRDTAVSFRQKFLGEEVELLATWIHSGGKMSTAAKPTDSAFFWREAVYHMYFLVEWEDKWMEKDMRDFLGKAKAALRPLSLQQVAAFVNFPDGAMPGEQSELAYFGDNYKELREVKKIWDKDNFFQFKQGVRLPGGAAPQAPGPQSGGNDEDLTDSLAGQQWETEWKFLEIKDYNAVLDKLDSMW